eukprot:TRINITY_DN18160_c0_g1_i1.p1 TRINITY_DN18160_c0_g1~~TRINITY_DN18160_c0_g1_i1.p1  ORF type:complete len:864 (+),score=305.15 TRINITY_DN18160_c0_g1_i1:151-2742(+)
MEAHFEDLAAEPLLLAAAAMPLLLRIVCCVKLPARRPVPAAPAAVPAAAAAAKQEKQKTEKKAAKKDGGKANATAAAAADESEAAPPPPRPRTKRRVVLRRFMTGMALFFAVGVAAVLAVWKGAAVIGVAVVLLFLAARGLTRAWLTFDLLLAVAACSALCLLQASKPSHNMSVLVSQDPSIASYPTIAAGLAAVSESGTVRILPGVYNEAVQLSKAVTLEGIGRAPNDVVIQSPKGSSPTLCITSDSLVRNVQILPPDMADRPTIYVGDSFLGAVLEDTEVGCSLAPPGQCVFLVGGHPFLKHVFRNVTLLPAKPRAIEFVEEVIENETEAAAKEPPPPREYISDEGAVTRIGEAVFEKEKMGLMANGTARASQPFHLETEMMLIRMTEHHVVSVVMLLKWVDVSAHWVTIGYRHFMKDVVPVLLLWFEVAKDVVGVWVATFRSFVCAAGQVPSVCPEPHPHHETAYAVGETVFNVIGIVIVHVILALAVAGGYLWAAVEYVFHHAVVPAAGWLLATIPVVLWACFSAYLNTSQYLQLAHHLAFFVLNVWMSFKFEHLGSGYLVGAALTLSKNLPTIVMLGTEYLIGLTLVLGSWFVFPLILPFISSYAIMVVTHTVLPVQSAYTLLRRHAGGKYQRSAAANATVLLVRAVIQLWPALVYVLCISAFYALKSVVDKNKEKEKETAAAAPAASWNPFNSPYFGFLASVGRTMQGAASPPQSPKMKDPAATAVAAPPAAAEDAAVANAADAGDAAADGKVDTASPGAQEAEAVVGQDAGASEKEEETGEKDAVKEETEEGAPESDAGASAAEGPAAATPPSEEGDGDGASTPGEEPVSESEAASAEQPQSELRRRKGKGVSGRS